MSRIARALGFLAMLAAVVTMLPGTAQAVAPFAKAHRVLPDSCAGSLTVLDSSGARHGFTLCRLTSGYDDLDAVTAAPGATSWTRSRVASKAQFLMAVADDGHSSYALFTTTSALDLLTRTRSGSTHVEKLAGGRNGGAPEGGALVVRGPVLTYRASQDTAGGAVIVSEGKAGKWSKPHTLTTKNQVGKLPTVNVSGKTTRVTWLEYDQKKFHYVAEVATKVGSGAWHMTTFTTPAAFDTAVVSRPQAVESKGKVFVAWTVLSATNKETIEVEEHTGGKWTHREVGDGTSGDAVLTQLAAIKGRAYLVMEHSDQTIYDLTTHQ